MEPRTGRGGHCNHHPFLSVLPTIIAVAFISHAILAALKAGGNKCQYLFPLDFQRAKLFVCPFIVLQAEQTLSGGWGRRYFSRYRTSLREVQG